MIILTIRTDKADAEIGLFDGQEKIEYETWQADHELSLTILQKIKDLLERNQRQFKDLEGILVYKGPGSFTGLRIGLSVANTLAYGLHIAVVASSGDDWLESGQHRLMAGDNENITLPSYGAEANITKPKK